MNKFIGIFETFPRSVFMEDVRMRSTIYIICTRVYVLFLRFSQTGSSKPEISEVPF